MATSRAPHFTGTVACQQAMLPEIVVARNTIAVTASPVGLMIIWHSLFWAGSNHDGPPGGLQAAPQAQPMAETLKMSYHSTRPTRSESDSRPTTNAEQGKGY
jgi:hypothetical protein